MLGFNGGLVGKTRINYSLTKSLPGVWTPNEQSNAIRDSNLLTPRDPHYSSVVLLLHGDGANGSTTFTDSSPVPKMPLFFGGAQISTTNGRAAFGGASMSFVRSPSSYLTFSNANFDFYFGTSDFTIEAWIRLNALPSGGGYPDSYWLVGGGPQNSVPGFDIAFGNTNLVVSLTNFDSPNINTAHGLSINTWYHIAVVRSGSTLYAFRDGTQLATASVSGVTSDPMLTGLAISAAEPVGSTQGNFNGYIDELRITRGFGRYTAAFPAPTVPFPNQ